ncbi:Eukaryotic translation initiation factor 2-alpha kinase gcn-2 [Hondaea fermentalgiana]|uniref:Eukaryotic translation initiation factor 2-alpha kinase gcn-2 n=1 Tax=Hondaea fermentalgiana TaxID=2315210 RepID=A0A2R5GZR5_9STRA|nr:Eukaryotic translation initiation factor 2-alpha kinase gcn-2 [Hondaea fermentalgiana]|eukprot:GBG35298.1 Eukaryotic translation initiation factor 2-alpha kinase gcn-2 [Hondaea fermentalgiana]
MTQPLQTTKQYMAPELLRDEVVDKVESAVDMYSVGVVLAKLFENTEISEVTKSLISSLWSEDPIRAAAQPDAHVKFLRDGSMCCVASDCELLIRGHAIETAVREDFANWLNIVRKHFERDAAAEQERQL